MDARKIIVFCLTLIIFCSSSIGADRIVPIGLKLIKLKKYKNFSETSIYNEVMNYSESPPFGDEHGRSTNVHETVHGINSYIRNKFYKDKINGFYAGSGYGILVKNPKLRLRQIKDYVPLSLRGYRFNLYFEKQLGDWDDTPTYHIDEWSAYIAGAECAVDDANRDISFKERSDSVSGALEFSIYCTALAMATKDLDKTYWDSEEQLKQTINYFLIKAEKVFFEGQKLFPSKAQDLLLYNLRNSTDAKPIRDFLITEFGGIFVD
jgi:hypothetical protein